MPFVVHNILRRVLLHIDTEEMKASGEVHWAFLQPNSLSDIFFAFLWKFFLFSQAKETSLNRGSQACFDRFLKHFHKGRFIVESTSIKRWNKSLKRRKITVPL